MLHCSKRALLAGHGRIGYRGHPAVRPAIFLTGGQTAKAARPKVNGATLRPVPHGKRPSARDGNRSGRFRCRRLCGRLGRSSFRRGIHPGGSGLFLGCFFLSRLLSRLFFGCLLRSAGRFRSSALRITRGFPDFPGFARRRFPGPLACRLAPRTASYAFFLCAAFFLRRFPAGRLIRFRHAPLLCASRLAFSEGQSGPCSRRPGKARRGRARDRLPR